MQMLSERGVNVGMFPMINKRGRSFNENYIRERNRRPEFIAEAGSKWDIKCYKLMDYLATEIRLGFVKNLTELNPDMGIPKNPSDPRLTSSCAFLNNASKAVNILENDIYFNSNDASFLKRIYQMSFTRSLKEIAKAVPGFSDSRTVKEAIIQVANCKIKMRYPIYSFSEKDKKYNFNFVYNNFDIAKPFDSFFNYELIEGNSRSDGRVYNESCVFHLNTMIAACFLHNIFTGGYQLIDEPFYSLSESTHLIYRKRLFIYSNINTILTQDYVTYALGLNSKYTSERNKIFNRIVDELVDNKLVRLDKKDKNGSAYLYKEKRKRNKVLPIVKETVGTNT